MKMYAAVRNHDGNRFVSIDGYQVESGSQEALAQRMAGSNNEYFICVGNAEDAGQEVLAKVLYDAQYARMTPDQAASLLFKTARLNPASGEVLYNEVRL